MTDTRLFDPTLFCDAAIYPGGAHGFTLFPNAMSRSAVTKMDAFLNRVLD